MEHTENVKPVDLSAWAADFGAEGLEPHDSEITLRGSDDQAILSIRVGFHTNMPEELRFDFMAALAQAVADANG